MRVLSACGILIATLISTAAFAQQTIRIGVAAALTGPLASVGSSLVIGAQRAADAINAAGGASGARIEIYTFDDGGNPAQARTIAQRAVNDRIRFMIGHSSNNTSTAAADVYEQARILRIEPRSSMRETPRRAESTIFSICGPDSERSLVLASYLQKIGVTSARFVPENNNYSRAMLDQLKAGLAPAQIAVTATENAQTPQDVLNAIKRADSSGKTAVIINFADIGALDFAAIKTLVQKVPVFVDWTMVQPISSRYAGSASDVFVLQEIDQAVGIQLPPNLAGVRSQGAVVSNSALLAFAAIQIIAEGVRRAGSDDTERIFNGIRSGQAITSLIGNLKFDSSGNAGLPRFAIYGLGPGSFRPDGSSVTCPTGSCQCKDRGCSRDCCAK